MKEFDSCLVDDSLSLADVVRNSTNERATCRSVQSKSYDVMYCTAKSNRNDGERSCAAEKLRQMF